MKFDLLQAECMIKSHKFLQSELFLYAARLKIILHCLRKRIAKFLYAKFHGWFSIFGLVVLYFFNAYTEVLIRLRNLELQSCLVSDGGQGIGHLNFWEVFIATNQKQILTFYCV